MAHFHVRMHAIWIDALGAATTPPGCCWSSRGQHPDQHPDQQATLLMPPPRYEYVGGGFEEASPQGKAANSSLYKAFDSALRASDYNMFCAPLKKVDAPTAFKAKGMSPEVEEAMLSPEPAEDPEEVARRIADEYAEFDRLVAGSSIKSDGQARLLKGKKGKLGSTNTRVRGRSVPTEKEDASTPDTVQKAPQVRLPFLLPPPSSLLPPPSSLLPLSSSIHFMAQAATREFAHPKWIAY
jgi:hypothetical protein